MTTQFTIPLPKGGSIVCSSPRDKIYLLTFSAPPDNRLTTPFCNGLLLALDIIERRFDKGVVVTTSAITKFYSNGLDLEHARDTPGFFPKTLYHLFARLLMFPMPTIALINGHAFAGAFMLAMYHDYRVFNPSRGFLCLNELDFGVPLKPPMSGIFREKLSPQVYRTIVLEAKRYGSKDALQDGIVDVLGGMEELLDLVENRKLVEKGSTNIYHLMKIEMYRDSLVDLDDYANSESSAQQREISLEKSSTAAEKIVKDWETKSKL